jgi:hypothetical protein
MPGPDLEGEVYKQSCENHRFYGDMRFKQLTLWSVGIGFVLNVLHGKEASSVAVGQKGTWLVAAFFWTAVIWVMEVRSTVHGVRAMRLKDCLETSMERERPADGSTTDANSEAKPRGRDLPNKWTLLNATNVVCLLYALSSLLELLCLRRAWGISTITFWIEAFVFVLLVAFTIREYWELWQHAVKEWHW